MKIKIFRITKCLAVLVGIVCFSTAHAEDTATSRVSSAELRSAQSINWFYSQDAVGPVNMSPELAAIPDQTTNEEQTLSYTLVASDPDAGDSLTLALASGPSFCLIQSNQNLVCQPTIGDAGEYTIQVSVTDDGDPPLSVSTSFSLNVLPQGIMEVEYCRTPFTAIGDLGGINDLLSITTDYVIEDINILLQVEHTFVGDLFVSLSQLGTVSIVLINAPINGSGSCSNDNIDVIFDDEGADGSAASTCNASDPAIDGALTPEGPLSAYDGQNINSDWLLNIDDDKAGDTGVLERWCIQATVSELPDIDTDGDGVIDSADNCTDIPNPDQRDSDADGIGNACDADYTNDCIVNFLDLNVYAMAFNSVVGAPNFNPDVDSNGDDAINFLDLILLSNTFFQPPGPSANECMVP